jgi:hypothetical protein
MENNQHSLLLQKQIIFVKMMISCRLFSEITGHIYCKSIFDSTKNREQLSTEFAYIVHKISAFSVVLYLEYCHFRLYVKNYFTNLLRHLVCFLLVKEVNHVDE